jgi:crotonobetainyl-CoA:carnitine CoA-transferase CaiB-like acyl-CoA transferase
MGGVMSLTGEEDGPPVKVGFAIADLTAGLFATIGILAALVERAHTGRGRVVRTSLFEGQLALHTSWATGYFATRERPERLGSGHPNIVPYQAYAAADGHLVVCVGNEEMWRAFCEAIGRPALRDDPRFERNRDRVEHREALNVELERVFTARTVDEWLTVLREARVPAAPIWSLDQIYAAEQTRVLGMLGTVGGLDQIRFPVTFDGERPPLRSAPPALGEANDELPS